MVEIPGAPGPQGGRVTGSVVILVVGRGVLGGGGGLAGASAGGDGSGVVCGGGGAWVGLGACRTGGGGAWMYMCT